MYNLFAYNVIQYGGFTIDSCRSSILSIVFQDFIHTIDGSIEFSMKIFFFYLTIQNFAADYLLIIKFVG